MIGCYRCFLCSIQDLHLRSSLSNGQTSSYQYQQLVLTFGYRSMPAFKTTLSIFMPLLFNLSAKAYHSELHSLSRLATMID